MVLWSSRLLMATRLIFIISAFHSNFYSRVTIVTQFSYVPDRLYNPFSLQYKTHLCLSFSNTYTTVKANSNVIWRFQRYQQITEYSTRPILVPPFSVFVNIYQLALVICNFCRGKKGINGVDRKLSKWTAVITILDSKESFCCVDEYLVVFKKYTNNKTTNKMVDDNNVRRDWDSFFNRWRVLNFKFRRYHIKLCSSFYFHI